MPYLRVENMTPNERKLSKLTKLQMIAFRKGTYEWNSPEQMDCTKPAARTLVRLGIFENRLLRGELQFRLNKKFMFRMEKKL